MTPTPEQLIRPEIQRLSAYHVPPATGLLKLDAMENPYAWPGELAAEWQAALSKVPVNRYPDPAAASVKDALRRAMKIPEKYALLLGNGSDEIIQILAMAVAGPERVVLAPEPSFVMYRMIATFVGMRYEGVVLNADFTLNKDLFVRRIAEVKPSLVFIAQPNNPTGNGFDEASLRAIITATPGLVVIDEAYMAFTDTDSLSLLDDFDNLVIMRTLSKVGLAGLRLGLLIGHPRWLNEFEKLRLPYNINSLTQASTLLALAHMDQLRAQAAVIRGNRTVLAAGLAELPGATVFPSEANFVLVRLASGARAAFDALLAAGILVKCLDGAHPLLSNCLRITVGLAEDNARVISALRSHVGVA